MIQFKLIGFTALWVLLNGCLATGSTSFIELAIAPSLSTQEQSAFSVSQQSGHFRKTKNIQEPDQLTQRFATDYKKWEKEREKQERQKNIMEIQMLNKQEEHRQKSKACQDGLYMFRQLPKPGKIFSTNPCQYVNDKPK